MDGHNARRFKHCRRIVKNLARHLKIDVAKKATKIRHRKNDFPAEIRSTIDEWKDEPDPNKFLGAIQDGLLQLIEGAFDRIGIRPDCTQAEFEVAIRFFPNLLWYPLRLLRQCENFVHFLPFVPVYAKLGVESGGYAERERGGMIVYGDFPIWNTLRVLCVITAEDVGDSGVCLDEEEFRRRNNFVEKECLTAIVRLREMGLFKKEDMIEHDLITAMMRNQCRANDRRLQYLINWCPASALASISANKSHTVVFDFFRRVLCVNNGVLFPRRGARVPANQEEGNQFAQQPISYNNVPGSGEDDEEEFEILEPANKKPRCK
jgi:hypothetical protein